MDQVVLCPKGIVPKFTGLIYCYLVPFMFSNIIPQFLPRLKRKSRTKVSAVWESVGIGDFHCNIGLEQDLFI